MPIPRKGQQQLYNQNQQNCRHFMLIAKGNDIKRQETGGAILKTLVPYVSFEMKLHILVVFWVLKKSEPKKQTDSLDDEGEAPPRSVGIYEFVDGEDEPISFAELPIQWKKVETSDGKQKQIFLRGSFDKGLQKIYKQVVAWKFDLSNEKPEISVLTKENYWIRLLNPRKAFENIIRTILITVHCLHLVKRNPGTSHKALWDHLGKVFSLFEPRPSENDLVDHVSLIDEAVKRDATLAKSKVVLRIRPVNGLGNGDGMVKKVSEDSGPPSAMVEDGPSVSGLQDIVPRIFRSLFSEIQKEHESSDGKQINYLCRCSFLEHGAMIMDDLLLPGVQ
ncbi:unnamed protein product [Fraxinus pennsylvanica]|uniref:RFTS domain-containing protein n=1 Tax=Fraxinus pennsylvanica TaxID=56036 RepID=A0AAD2A9P3_9LAMI|nr:unnamed protein product [Fraxinus pennsylvanica]